MNQTNEPSSKCPQTVSAWQAAIDYGIDVSLTEYLLTLTPAERVARHEQALALVRMAREAGVRHYGIDPRSAPPTE